MSNKYYHIIGSEFIKERGNSYLIKLPVVNKNKRKSKPEFFVNKFIGKKISGFILPQMLFVIQDWIYKKLENSWWEDTERESSEDKFEYTIPLYEDYSQEKIYSLNDINNLKKEQEKKLNNFIKYFNKLIDLYDININNTIKLIELNKNNKNLLKPQFIITFKNNQKGIVEYKIDHYNITINNKTRNITDNKFIYFLLALNKKLYTYLKDIAYSYDPYVSVSGTTSEKRNNNFILQGIEYLSKLNSSKAKELQKIIDEKDKQFIDFMSKKNENNTISLKELLLNELERKRVIRKGKVKRKIKCKPGQKVVNGRCVTMTGAEKATRKRAAKKAAIKRKSKKSQSNIKRKKSNKKRKSMGL